MGATIKTSMGTHATTGATTLRRGNIYYIYNSIAQAGTVADQVFSTQIQRYTAAGTATAQVAAPLDPADAAALLTSNVSHSVEPTFTATTNVIFTAQHVRATLQIHLQPDSHLIIPNTNVAGFGVQNGSAAYTGNILPGWHYIE
jgi:transketolase